MDKNQAQAIVRNTFENSFDKSKFSEFVKHLLNFVEEAPFSYKGNLIPDAYEQHVSLLERIGKYTDGEHKIDILIVKLKKETSIERARTMQRNFIARYLNGSRGGELKDAALVAFVSPNNEDWRFSLVKMDYRFEEGKDDKVKVKEEFTPARRWSFLVGTNEKSHTAQTQLVSIIMDDQHIPTLEELEEAFNIEKATKEFFEKYRDLFLWTKEELDKIVKENQKVKADFTTKEVNPVDFAKKLLGQIVFLYFLQKKGWFGVKRDEPWGTGSKHFLRELFERKLGEYSNFFNDILEPLFYDALRNDRSHDDHYYSRFNCKIPFLNGGLFDPIKDYDWVHTDIHLPNELFSNTTKTKEGDTGTGILDIFDRYNFTVKEDEPLEKEVAIDPELLGKAYEKFNAIRPDNYEEYKEALKNKKKGEEHKFNRQYGVYYTPREIVHYMCQQSLICYLHTELNQKAASYENIGEQQTDLIGDQGKKGQLDLSVKHTSGQEISKEDIETFIKSGEQVGENEATVIAKGRETETYYHKIPESIRQNAQLIDDKLANIKVCDPAIGSGAFPVGMMSEIVKARNVLTTYLLPPDKGGTQGGLENCPPDKGGLRGVRTMYHFKRDCIENSLYGVDIDPGAVEIAKLRLWLSLVVDEEDIKQIKPLPNLDYKIVCGNSLLGVEKNIFNNELFVELERLKPLLFNETSPKKKQDYKNQIDGLISQITKGHKEFDFEVYFSEVFHEKGGFDVVIGNPPYGIELSTAEKEYFQLNYKSARTIPSQVKGSLDTFSLFTDRGLQLCNTQHTSVLAYIVSMAITSSESMIGLHKLIFESCETTFFSTYSNRPNRIFGSADQRVAIIILRKNLKPSKEVFTTKLNKRYRDTTIQELIDNLRYVNAKKFLLRGRIPKVGTETELNILSKLFSIETKLGDLIDEKGKAIYYRTAGGRYFNVVTNLPTGSTKEKSLFIKSDLQNLVGALLSSNLYFWFLHIYSDTLDIKSYELEIFPIPVKNFSISHIDKIEILYRDYLLDLERNARVIRADYNNVSSFKEYRARKSKPLIDKIDLAIKDAYGLSDKEIDFIINYDIQFRTDEVEKNGVRS